MATWWLLGWLTGATAWAGWSIAPMPIGDYSTDHGFGYGGFVQATRRMDGEDLYRLRLGLQMFWSTGAYRDHWLKADWPLSERWRIEGVGGWRAWDFAPYYGREDGSELPESDDPLYFTHSIRGARALVNVRRQLAGDWAVFASGFLRTADVAAPSGSYLDGHAAEDGRYSSVALGLLLDSRDRMPSPTAGHLAEISVRGSGAWTGSQWSGGGVNLTERAFWSPVENAVLATRATVDLRWGETPFFAEHILGGSQWLTLGGPWGLRAFPEGRFRGDGTLMLSPELRWTAWTIGIREHTLALMPTPFADAAWIWTWDPGPGAIQAGPIRSNLGFGARFVWDEDFVLRMDTAVGRDSVPGAERSVGIWFMFDHPF